MCPACLATVGLLAGAVSSAGVAAAYLFEKLRKDKAMKPLGRNEKDLPQTMSWVRHHDRHPDSAWRMAPRR